MKNMTIQQFAMQTASNEPVPGGGSIKIRRCRRRDEGGDRTYERDMRSAFRRY